MSLSVFSGIILPFIGTTLGSAAVFLSRKTHNTPQNAPLYGFSAGVMMAASVWSLIIPAVNMSVSFGFFSFVPPILGIWLGILFMLAAERHLSFLGHENLMFLAVILHNIPEGMAVGIAFAPAFAQHSPSLILSALVLSFAMTMQNIPEGAIVSLVLAEKGESKSKSFILGSLSGIAEPVFAFITLLLSTVFAMFLPYFLGFSAGAMIYISANELIPKADTVKGTLFFTLGFCVMMVLDIALG